MFMSDGGTGDNPDYIMDQIHTSFASAKLQVKTLAFGSGADKQILRRMAQVEILKKNVSLPFQLHM
jgi:hypothetical protein